MYDVSQAYHDAMRASQRPPVLARVTIDFSAAEGDESIEVQVSERTGSFPDQIVDSVETVAHPWASLDGSWHLDAKRPYRLMPETEQEALMYHVGWWGRQIADQEGYFSEPYPTITITHLPRSVLTLMMVGDSARREWPVDFTIALYDQENNLICSKTVTDNTELEWISELEQPVQGVAKQVAVITRWSHPGRQAKIAEFFCSIQQTYEGRNLLTVNLLEERETSSASLPVGNISSNEIAVRMVNDGRFDPDNEASPLYNLMLPNRRVRARLGVELENGREWVPLGTFWSVEWNTDSDAPVAMVRARDLLERLRTTTYRTSVVQQDAKASDLARAILLDAGLRVDQWEIHESLDGVVFPWAWLPVVSHREALLLIAEAALTVVYCDRDGRIRVGAPMGTEPVYEIDTDNWLSMRSPTRHDQVLNEIIVTARPLAPSSSPSEVYRSTSPVTIPAGQKVAMTVQYQDPPVMSASASLENLPDGVSIVDAQYYAWGADITIENTGETDEDVTIVVTGIRLVAQTVEAVVAADQESQLRYGRKVYEYRENHLIQTREQAAAIAEALLASTKDPRRDVEVHWRGHPALELGDVVDVITDPVQDRRGTYVTVRQELEWAGYLRAKLTGRRIT